MAETVVTGNGGAAASMASWRPSTKAIGPPWDAVCVASDLFELLQPGALLRGIETSAQQAGVGRQRAHPGAESEFAQQVDEAHQIAARTGAAAKIELAGLRLVEVGRDGEFHGLHTDVLEPDQLALP